MPLTVLLAVALREGKGLAEAGRFAAAAAPFSPSQEWVTSQLPAPKRDEVREFLLKQTKAIER